MTYENTKKTIYIVLGAVVLLGLIYGLTQYFNKSDNSEKTLDEITAMESKEKIKALEQRVSDLESEAQSLSSDAPNDEKYSAYISLAEAQLELDRFDAAIGSLNSIPENYKNRDRVYYSYGKAYKGKGDIAQAKDNAKKAVELDDNDVQAWLLYIDVSIDLTNEQLDALYREAIAKTKSDVDIMISYANFNDRIGNKATAIAAWETAVNIDPRNSEKYQHEIDRLKQ